MALVGYARISTSEGGQIMDRQLDALAAAGCERVFEDRASGATGAKDRPGLKDCLDWLRAGDVLRPVVDRLSDRCPVPALDHPADAFPVGVGSPGDYAASQFPPLPRHDPVNHPPCDQQVQAVA